MAVTKEGSTVPKIICVHSFRAGAGKTTVAANVATLLAAHGQRVCLLDANFRAPEIHGLFRVDEKMLPVSLADFLLGKCQLPETVQDISGKLGENLKGRMYLSTALGKSNDAARVQAEGYNLNDLKDGLDVLIDEFDLDFVITDTTAGLNERTLPLVAISDILTIVMLLDKQDFQGTGVLIDVARKIDVPDVFLVINSVPVAFDQEKIKTEAEQAYHCRVAAIVPHDMSLLEQANSRYVSLDKLQAPIPVTLKALAQKCLELLVKE